MNITIIEMKNLLNFLKTQWLDKEEYTLYFSQENNLFDGAFSLELFEYIFGKYLNKISEQDYYQRSEIVDCYGNKLIKVIGENQDCWTLATNKNLSKTYCNAWNLNEDRAMNEFQEMNFCIEESLISFAFQEIFFSAAHEITVKPAMLKKLKETSMPLWINKHYVWNEPSHSFYYQEAHKILIFELYGEVFGGYVVSKNLL